MARKGEAVIELGLSCFAVQQFIARLKVCVSFYFLIFQMNSSVTKTQMQQRRKGPGRYHSCAVLPVWPWCAGRISVSWTSKSTV